MDVQNLFSTVLNMTVTGSVITAVVLLTRLVLRKAPRVFSYWLWLVVLFRLLCPVSVSAPVSVLGAVDAPAASEAVGTVVWTEEYVSPPAASPTLPASPAEPAEREIDWQLRLPQVWAAGVGAMAIYGVLSYVSLKRRLRESVPVEKGVREADGIRSPFVLGFFRPVIYLPSGLRDREAILLHERYHIRHADPVVKGLYWLAVCIHWFNPVVWLAFVLCGRDMELRCDEAVLKKLGSSARSGYAQSLLDCAAGRQMAPTPLAFCQGDTRRRVKHVLNWKKNKLWVAVLAAVLSFTVAVLSACNPDLHSYENQRVFNYRYRAEAVLGDPDPVNSYYYPREHDNQLTLWVDEAPTELGELVQKSLDSGFGLTDEGWERELREQNDLAWNAGEYWLLYQEDDSVWLTQGRDRVLRLDRVRDIFLRVQTKENFGKSYELRDYPLNSGYWNQESQDLVPVSGEATLVWAAGAETVLEVREEYHQINPDGTETVTEICHSLDRTADYGFELPIARRGEQEGDWAMYRVELGLSCYVFCVRFGSEVPGQAQEVTYSEGTARISLMLPEGWSYTVSSLEQNDYCAGITFWPTGREEGVLRLEYYPQHFAVCGTGLETTTMTLAGQEVTVGTYDGGDLWTYICFDRHFALWGQGHKSWWDEYGAQAMSILDSAQFARE